ncbi:MarR family winged helix-turn-helix transcriptional regulator [Pseudomonas sp. Pseusp3]|uniref:MarR family winged helix-turn-helix transcriptional regulator n=1 Tax=Pseudomonas sp. Pseusp3 TaxID=3243029 RepID=UPI0039AF1C2D
MKLIGQVSRTFSRLVDTPLRELGLSVGQLPVLVTLKNVGAISQGELARIARVEQPSMAQLLSRMERDELVQRVLDPADGRSRLISLSAQATRQLPKAKRVMDQTCSQALDGLSADEQALLHELLLKVDANLNRALEQMQKGSK